MYNKNEEKIISVFDNAGKFLSKTTLIRADKLIDRKCAYWIGKNKLCLALSKKDRRNMKNSIIKESNNICYICNQKTDKPSIDHVIPKSFYKNGGTDLPGNLKCCCVRCNKDKGARTLKEYINHINKHRDKYKYISDTQLEKLKELSKHY